MWHSAPMLNRTGPLRRIIVGLSIVAAVVAAGTGPAGGQAEPTTTTTTTTIPADLPEVEVVEFFAEGGGSYRDCEGQETPVFGGFVEIFAERTGDDDEALVVPITYSGPAAEDLGETSDLEFAPDDQEGFAFAELGDGASGTLIVTLEPGPGYVVAGEGTFEVEISNDDVIADCNEPLPVGDDQANQTIQVGDRPEPIFDELFGGEFGDDPEFAEFYETPVVGDLPPGLTYVDDVFGGAATTPGVYDFQVRLCIDPDSEDFASERAVDPEMRRMQRALGDVDTPCFGTVDVRIEVLPADVVPTVPVDPGTVPVTPGTEPVAPVSPPAVPIPTEATFTG